MEGQEIWQDKLDILCQKQKSWQLIKWSCAARHRSQSDQAPSAAQLSMTKRAESDTQECTSRSHILNHYSRPPLTKKKSNEEGKGMRWKPETWTERKDLDSHLLNELILLPSLKFFSTSGFHGLLPDCTFSEFAVCFPLLHFLILKAPGIQILVFLSSLSILY